jgi:hypothetical protein
MIYYNFVCEFVIMLVKRQRASLIFEVGSSRIHMIKLYTVFNKMMDRHADR